MTTADRLLDGREQLRRRFREWQYGQQWLDALDEALAVERVATVERIGKAYRASHVRDGSEQFYQGIDAASANLFAILDEEAAR